MKVSGANDRPSHFVVIGNGRLGRALAKALGDAGESVVGPLGRKDLIPAEKREAGGATVVLLCVPERELANAARRDDIPAGALVGHCSASAPLDVLAPHERFSAHPLMTFTEDRSPADSDFPARRSSPFVGAACAIDGNTVDALNVARALATTLGMSPVQVPVERRTLYHAAASMASNFLVTLEGAAERLASASGVDRTMLAPLARASMENWAARGFHEAITGPLARGDEATVAAQRAAVVEAAPELVLLWDALAATTRAALPRVPRDPATRVVRTVAELRAVVGDARRSGARIGLVPTMGALHEGHLSLVRRARAECGLVVVSLFVNPTQFNDPRDLEAYPRDQQRDKELVAGAGADLLFAPAVAEVYPEGFATTVEVTGLTEPLEGVARGTGHFRGVATVVAKLFGMVQPDVAYFGQKDAQQALVIRRLARDLDFPLRVEVCPTVRESDGLAMSSRNVRLSPEARARATALFECLEAIARSVAGGERATTALLALGHGILERRGIVPADVEYLAIVDAETLEPLDDLAPGRAALVPIAVRVGGVRLIDNIVVTP